MLKSPCLSCPHRDEDKNTYTCQNCKSRIAYVREIGHEALPSIKNQFQTTKKETKPMAPKINIPTSCPFGLNFGIDFDTEGECSVCDELAWNECKDWSKKTPQAPQAHEEKRGRPPKHPAAIQAKQTIKTPIIQATETDKTPIADLDISKWTRIEFKQRYFSTPTMGVRDASISFNTSAVKDFNLQKFTCLEIFHNQNRLAMIPTTKDTQFRMKFNKSYCVVTSRRLMQHLKLKPGKYQIQNIGGRMLVEVETL